MYFLHKNGRVIWLLKKRKHIFKYSVFNRRKVLVSIIFFFFKQKTAYEISACLVGGEPGIGKSTLSLQIALAANGLKTLYVSGE